MKLTKYEQETIINFNNDEQEASIYTASPQMMRKLDALAAAYPEHYRVVGQTEVKKAVRENTEIKKNRKPNGRRAAMDMEKVQAVFLCHKIKNQTEK